MLSLCEENAKHPDSSTVPFRKLARSYLHRRQFEFFIKLTMEPLSGWRSWVFPRRLQFPVALMSHLQENVLSCLGLD